MLPMRHLAGIAAECLAAERAAVAASRAARCRCARVRLASQLVKRMTSTANQLRVALLNEHQHFAHDDFNSDVMNAAHSIAPFLRFVVTTTSLSLRQVVTTPLLLTSSCQPTVDRYTKRIRCVYCSHRCYFPLYSTFTCLSLFVTLPVLMVSLSISSQVLLPILFSNGAVYRYTNVSRRAIANLLINP